MASTKFTEMQTELQNHIEEYCSLLEEFKQHGDVDIFVDLQNSLLDLSDRSADLDDQEEQMEIISGTVVIKNAINCLTRSAS